MDQPTRRLNAPPPPRPPRRIKLKCPKCQGTVTKVLVVGSNGYVQLKRPDVWVGLLGGTSDLTAHVCTACGYTELYAANLEDLLRG